MNIPEEKPLLVPVSGAQLAVYEYGLQPGPNVPTLLLIHGYPDDHRMFLPLIDRLLTTHRIIAYDTRNAGQSAVTDQPGDFLLPTLVEDLFAVVSATAASSVHVVGHDWGSIQAWAAVQDPRAAGLVVRFTSISGPDLRHLNWWLRQKLQSPLGWPQLLGQLVRSLYVAAFQVPGLPEVLWRSVLTRRYEEARQRRVGDNPVRGLGLYRSNFPFLDKRLPVKVEIPVHVVLPDKDPFLSPNLTSSLEKWAPQSTVTRVDGGHWWPETHAADLALLVQEGSAANKT